MLLMKKDMGGAAITLAVADMVMALGLKVRLRVILPIVENAISGDAFRPGDILKSRKGLSVEIGNTDAEGRLILADALALAGEDPPDLLINYARSPARRGSRLGRISPRVSSMTRRSPPPCSPPESAWPIRSGGCRCTSPMIQCSTARSRM